MLRRVIRWVLALVALITAFAYLAAVREPAVRSYRITAADWPAGVPGVRLAFLSDSHMAGPDMPPSRLAAIVAQTNALKPDCVLLGGDYFGDKPFATRVYRGDALVAPFAALRPRIKTIGVAGNHDQGRNGHGGPKMLAALRRIGVTTLANEATRCGPLTVAGLDDPYSGKARPRETAEAAARLGGPTLLLTHSPELWPIGETRRFTVGIAGHTHCGQIALPFYGAIFTATSLGRRYACGMVREGRRVMIVGAGLGTSGVPLRLFTRPEILLLEVGPRGSGGSPPSPRPAPPTARSDPPRPERR